MRPRRRFYTGGLARTAEVLSSPQQRLKSRLRKVLVMRQRRLNLLRFHHIKTRAIGQAPTLIRRLLVAPQRALKLLRCLWNDPYVPVVTEFQDHAGNRPAEWTITEAVQELPQHHFGGYEPHRKKLLRDLYDLLMELVPRIHQADPVAGVGEDLLHFPVFLLPYR